MANIEELFKRVNKGFLQNSGSAIKEEDLNKVRAYVVQSKSPLLPLYSIYRLTTTLSSETPAKRTRREGKR
jgi:hypothetical protein